MVDDKPKYYFAKINENTEKDGVNRPGDGWALYVETVNDKGQTVLQTIPVPSPEVWKQPGISDDVLKQYFDAELKRPNAKLNQGQVDEFMKTVKMCQDLNLKGVPVYNGVPLAFAVDEKGKPLNKDQIDNSNNPVEHKNLGGGARQTTFHSPVVIKVADSYSSSYYNANDGFAVTGKEMNGYTPDKMGFYATDKTFESYKKDTPFLDRIDEANRWSPKNLSTYKNENPEIVYLKENNRMLNCFHNYTDRVQGGVDKYGYGYTGAGMENEQLLDKMKDCNKSLAGALVSKENPSLDLTNSVNAEKVISQKLADVGKEINNVNTKQNANDDRKKVMVSSSNTDVKNQEKAPVAKQNQGVSR